MGARDGPTSHAVTFRTPSLVRATSQRRFSFLHRSSWEIQAQTPSVHALFNGHRKLYPHSLTCPHPNPYIPMPSVLAALLLECRESKVCRCVKREREKRRQRPYGNKGEKRGGAPAFEVRREAG